MARIGFVCPPLLGHLNPLLALASQLRHAGHRTVFVLTSDAPRRALADVEIARTQFTSRDALYLRGTSFTGLLTLIGELAATTRALCTELPDIVHRMNLDALIVDQHEPAGALVARHLGVPYASAANALPINSQPGIPPYFTPWTPSTTPTSLRIFKGAQDVADVMTAPINRVIRQYATTWKLGDLRGPADLMSETCQIAQLTSSLDFDRKPPGLLYVGGMRGAPSPSSPWQPDTQKRLAFISFGTLLGGKSKLLSRIVAACKELDVYAVVADGGRSGLRSEPGTCEVAAYVDQRSVLSHAALCITHAGMNTTMDAVEAGVRTLAIPFGYDQPGIAARISWAGAGLSLAPRRAARKGALADMLARLLKPESCPRLPALADEARTAGGALKAARHIADGLRL